MWDFAPAFKQMFAPFQKLIGGTCTFYKNKTVIENGDKIFIQAHSIGASACTVLWKEEILEQPDNDLKNQILWKTYC